VTRLVREFSLDNEDGALSRLVERVERAQETITSEFSLDHEGSALRRLADLLESTNGAVERSLTLDDESSPLARLKREILDVLEQQNAANTNFQTEVRATLDSFRARREEQARGPRRGTTFEDEAAAFLNHECNRVGDICERVGTTIGRTGKVGDLVVALGPDSAAPGARIVVEDRATEESYAFEAEVRSDPELLMRLAVATDSDASERRRKECSVDDLSPEIRSRIARSMLADRLAQEQARFDEIFESSKALIARNHGDETIFPPIFRALAEDVINRRCERAADVLAKKDPRELTGADVSAATEAIITEASTVGIRPHMTPIGRVLERCLEANLRNVKGVGSKEARRSVELLRAAEKAGVEISRTRLEEMVYSLLSYHREILAVRLRGESLPANGIDPDALIQLAEQSNISLRTFGGA